MADKTLKSLNFGGADNYFPLPIVSTYNTNSNFTIDSSNKIISSICGSGRPNSSSNYILKTDIIEPKTYLVDVAGVVFPLTIA